MSALLDGYDALLTDLDGTIYHGTRVVDGADRALDTARESGLVVRFVTNNASRSADEVAEQLRGLGIAVNGTDVATSAHAAAAMLAARVAKDSPVLVVGSEALAEEVAAAGMQVTRTSSANPTAVVQGHSPHSTWADLAEACLTIDSGALWVACNTDATLPTERGALPGNGSMVAALRTATGRTPEVAGKPAPPLFTEVAAEAGARRALVVGDRLDTDIEGACSAGADALLVLSGAATPTDVLAAPHGQRPTYIGADVTSITRQREALEVGELPAWYIEPGDDALYVHSRGADDDAVALLRALCPAAWRLGMNRVVPCDERSRALAEELSLL